MAESDLLPSHLIVSGSDDRTIRIWDAESGNQIGDPLTGHDDIIRSFDGIFRTGDAQTVTNIQLAPDGWLIDTLSGCHLVWVPVPMRSNFFQPHTVVIIGKAGYTKISLFNCWFGSDWKKCYIEL
jgi:WD40 repeat protein